LILSVGGATFLQQTDIRLIATARWAARVRAKAAFGIKQEVK